jgi:hypothetical protein
VVCTEDFPAAPMELPNIQRQLLEQVGLLFHIIGKEK